MTPVTPRYSAWQMLATRRQYAANVAMLARLRTAQRTR